MCLILLSNFTYAFFAVCKYTGFSRDKETYFGFFRCDGLKFLVEVSNIQVFAAAAGGVGHACGLAGGAICHVSSGGMGGRSAGPWGVGTGSGFFRRVTTAPPRRFLGGATALPLRRNGRATTVQTLRDHAVTATR